MGQGETTAAIQMQLNQLGTGDRLPEDVRLLLDRSVSRLIMLCTNTLYRKYPRLARPPANLVADELLSAVVERLIKALKEVRPQTVRQFFALASQHVRWQLNDFARTLDGQVTHAVLDEGLVPLHDQSDSQLSDRCKQILLAIEQLPEDQREAFDLVRVQGLSTTEAAAILDVTDVTVRRRLNRAIATLSSSLQNIC